MRSRSLLIVISPPASPPLSLHVHCTLYYNLLNKQQELDVASRVRGNIWYLIAKLNPNSFANTGILRHARSGPGSFTMCGVRAIEVGSRRENRVLS